MAKQTTPPSPISGHKNGGYLRLHWSGHLHVSIRLDEYLGSNAYHTNGMWYIDIIFKSNHMLLRYDTEAKWKSVLYGLDTLL